MGDGDQALLFDHTTQSSICYGGIVVLVLLEVLPVVILYSRPLYTRQNLPPQPTFMSLALIRQHETDYNLTLFESILGAIGHTNHDYT